MSTKLYSTFSGSQVQAGFRPCSNRSKSCGMMTKACQAASILWEKPQTSPLQLILNSKAAVLLEQVSDGRPCCKQNRAHTEVPTQRFPTPPQQHTFPSSSAGVPCVPSQSLFQSGVLLPEQEHHQKERRGQTSRKAGRMLKPASYALVPVSRLSPALAVLVWEAQVGEGTTLLVLPSPAQATWPTRFGLPFHFKCPGKIQEGSQAHLGLTSGKWAKAVSDLQSPCWIVISSVIVPSKRAVGQRKMRADSQTSLDLNPDWNESSCSIQDCKVPWESHLSSWHGPQQI